MLEKIFYKWLDVIYLGLILGLLGTSFFLITQLLDINYINVLLGIFLFFLFFHLLYFFIPKEIKIKNDPPQWKKTSSKVLPIIIFIILFRQFGVEQFRVPSGSMLPNVLQGDVFLVDKTAYQWKIPVVDKVIYKFNNPKRYDLIVFLSPVDEKTLYFKRVIGVPGDKVEYDFKNNKLTINGKTFKREKTTIFHDTVDDVKYQKVIEYGNKTIETLENIGVLSYSEITKEKSCLYEKNILRCTIPDKNYFVLGDNRGDSFDSRYWGYVSEEKIIGKPFFMVLNLMNRKRNLIYFN